MMTTLQRRGTPWPFLGFATLFAALAIIGGVRSYTPIPFWDSWGIYTFVEQVANGDLSTWWEQHNEHRLVLTRLLQWLDIRLFDGSMAFLVLVNYAMAGASFLIFRQALLDGMPERKFTTSRLILQCTVFALSLSWLQMENFTWDFQSQFFGAELFPLLAFYLLYRSQPTIPGHRVAFLVAAGAGAFSIGTMANGLLALPLMVFLAWQSGLSRTRTLVLAALATIGIIAYFLGYASPGAGHSPVTEAIRRHPLDVASHTLIYLGGPIYHLLGMRADVIPQAMGLFVLGGWSYLSMRAVRAPHDHRLQLALLTFIAYVIATALITSAGRADLLGGALYLPSRYMTPTLMAWSALIVVSGLEFKCQLKENRGQRGLALTLLALLLALTPFQFRALQTHDHRIFLVEPGDLGRAKPHAEENFQRMVGALALGLGVRDPERIGAVFPDPDFAMVLVDPALRHGWSAYGEAALKDAKGLMGARAGKRPMRECMGHLDALSPIEGNDQHLRFSGWIFDRHERSVPSSVLLVDRQDRIIGYGVTGRPRPDVRRTVGRSAYRSGLEGYLVHQETQGRIRLIGRHPDCAVH